MRPPDQTYLVCATPRSGSTLLCELLRAGGIAGHPSEHFEVLRATGAPRQPREYFEGVEDFRVLDRLASLRPPVPGRADESAQAWWARIRADGTTPNGVWGGKLMWGHVRDLEERAGALPGLAGADLQRILETLLGDVRLVYVTRADKVAQAVSLWRAVQTQSWQSGPHDTTTTDCVAYVYEGIDHLRRQLEAHDAAWRGWFAAHGREVVEVSYEDLAAEPRATTAAVLAELGLPADGVPEPDMRRQGDARSEAWAERYRAEAGVRA